MSKMNRLIIHTALASSSQVAVFSNSQLRLILQKQVWCPGNWYVNCTRGGRFCHVAAEVKDSKVPDPRVVVLLVGTNDMSTHCNIIRAEKDFANLPNTSRSQFPTSRVCI